MQQQAPSKSCSSCAASISPQVPASSCSFAGGLCSRAATVHHAGGTAAQRTQEGAQTGNTTLARACAGGCPPCCGRLSGWRACVRSHIRSRAVQPFMNVALQHHLQPCLRYVQVDLEGELEAAPQRAPHRRHEQAQSSEQQTQRSQQQASAVLADADTSDAAHTYAALTVAALCDSVPAPCNGT